MRIHPDELRKQLTEGTFKGTVNLNGTELPGRYTPEQFKELLKKLLTLS
jgi:hypothetical protein